MIEFANHLDRNDSSLLWNVAQQFEHDIALFSAVDPSAQARIGRPSLAVLVKLVARPSSGFDDLLLFN